MAPKGAGDGLDSRTRAEDILLGSLGFGPEAKIVSVQQAAPGYRGIGVWADGEQFEFSSDDEADDLQRWALEVLQG